MANTLLSVPTTLRPTSHEASTLEQLYQAAQEIHLTIRRWLRIRGAGLTMHVREALWQAAEGQALPHIDDNRLIDIRLDALAELAQLTARDLPPVWQKALPDMVLQRMLDIESRRLEHLRSGIRAGRAFPLLPLDRLPLDEATCAVDEFQVNMPGFSEPVVYDAWALPTALMEALLIEADAKVMEINAHWQSLLERALRGDSEALPAMTSLYESARPWLGREPTRWLDRSQPHRYQHVSLVREVEGSEVRWRLHWTMRIPASYLPRATVDDAMGIDLGYRQVVTAATAAGVSSVARQIRPPDNWPQWEKDDQSPLLLAQIRRACFEPHRAALEGLLMAALGHREVRLEATDWEGLHDHGITHAVTGMQLTGARYFAEWLEILKKASGTVITRVEAAGSSSHCFRCGASVKRPSPYTQVYCPQCAAWEDADINSARWIRLGNVPSLLN